MKNIQYDQGVAFKEYDGKGSSLRKEFFSILNGRDVKQALGLGDDFRPLVYIDNDYVDNGNGTISDLNTGLMWERNGSEYLVSLDGAGHYVAKLNREKSGGYDDWRMPTILELTSLLEPGKMNGCLHIDPKFDSRQMWLWSSDTANPELAWYVTFFDGSVFLGRSDLKGNGIRGVRFI